MDDLGVLPFQETSKYVWIKWKSQKDLWFQPAACWTLPDVGHGSTCYHRGRWPLDRWSPGFRSPDPNRALVPRDPGAGLEGCLPAFSEFMALKMMKSLKSRDFYGFLATWAKSVEFQQPSKPNRSELHLYLHSCIVCVYVNSSVWLSTTNQLWKFVGNLFVPKHVCMQIPWKQWMDSNSS